jgi:hypothetical protein
VKVERKGEGNFAYFLAALPVLIGLHVGIRALGRRLRAGRPVRKAMWLAGTVGAALAGASAVAFMSVFGTPDGLPGSGYFLGAIFVVAGWQTGRHSAKDDPPLAGERPDSPPCEVSA